MNLTCSTLFRGEDDSNDVYFLADAYYQNQDYEQALDIINNKQALNKNIHCRYLAGLCAVSSSQ